MHLDLHRHLEGCHSPAALADVARELDLRRPPFFDAAAGRFLTADELTPLTTLAAASDDPMAFYRCIVAARRVRERGGDRRARRAGDERGSRRDRRRRSAPQPVLDDAWS